jgi:hypothetical protein
MLVLLKMLGLWLDIGDKPVASFCENDDENSDIVKDGNFFTSSEFIGF